MLQCATLGGPLLERGSGILCSIPDDSERVSRVVNPSSGIRNRPLLEPRAATTNTPISAVGMSSQLLDFTEEDATERSLFRSMSSWTGIVSMKGWHGFFFILSLFVPLLSFLYDLLFLFWYWSCMHGERCDEVLFCIYLAMGGPSPMLRVHHRSEVFISAIFYFIQKLYSKFCFWLS